MKTDIFKFGGASVNSAGGIRNVAEIIRSFHDRSLIVIVSAMGKTTNALERVLNDYMQNDPIALIENFTIVESYHYQILDDLFPDKNHWVYNEVSSLFDQLRGYIRKGHLYTADKPGYDFEYDQIVSYGELISSAILYHYLLSRGIPAELKDVRELVKTDDLNRDARVNWPLTRQNIRETFLTENSKFNTPGQVFVTQGFIGGDPAGNTTTLGREGSDFTAAIFAWSLEIKEMVVWKDVPGVMNADPRWMPGAVKLETLSYREAIELAYYGASVIHPKTIRPLENAGITLHVKSFNDPSAAGTRIENIPRWKISHPIYIRKQNQILISLSSRDFSFILEDNLSEIFRVIAKFRVKVNVMQNSAISFSVCVDNDSLKIKPLLEFLSKEYEIRYNENLELLTIRHYSEQSLAELSKGKQILMELRSRNTCQLVTRNS